MEWKIKKGKEINGLGFLQSHYSGSVGMTKLKAETLLNKINV